MVHARPDAASIAEAIRTATSEAHRIAARSAPNPYGSGDTAARIADVLGEEGFARSLSKADLDYLFSED